MPLLSLKYGMKNWVKGGNTSFCFVSKLSSISASISTWNEAPYINQFERFSTTFYHHFTTSWKQRSKRTKFCHAFPKTLTCSNEVSWFSRRAVNQSGLYDPHCCRCHYRGQHHSSPHHVGIRNGPTLTLNGMTTYKPTWKSVFTTYVGFAKTAQSLNSSMNGRAVSTLVQCTFYFLEHTDMYLSVFIVGKNHLHFLQVFCDELLIRSIQSETCFRGRREFSILRLQLRFKTGLNNLNDSTKRCRLNNKHAVVSRESKQNFHSVTSRHVTALFAAFQTNTSRRNHQVCLLTSVRQVNFILKRDFRIYTCCGCSNCWTSCDSDHTLTRAIPERKN